jgi:uncharacterized membrane protein
MIRLQQFIKATIIGGLLFLIPVMVLLFTLAKAFEVLGKLVKPMANEFHYTHLAGISLVTLLSILVLLFICFLAGIFMHTGLAKKVKKKIEDEILIYIPGYSYLHALTTDKLEKNDSSNWKPATIVVDNNAILCFVIDESENYCSVFLPSAPTPSSGSVCVHKKENITYLPLNVSETISLLHHFGKGAAAALENIKAKTN